MQLSLVGAGDLEAVFSQKITSIVGILDCIGRFLKRILASFFFFFTFFMLMELFLCVKEKWNWNIFREVSGQYY